MANWIQQATCIFFVIYVFYHFFNFSFQYYCFSSWIQAGLHSFLGCLCKTSCLSCSECSLAEWPRASGLCRDIWHNAETSPLDCSNTRESCLKFWVQLECKTNTEFSSVYKVNSCRAWFFSVSYAPRLLRIMVNNKIPKNLKLKFMLEFMMVFSQSILCCSK